VLNILYTWYVTGITSIVAVLVPGYLYGTHTRYKTDAFSHPFVSEKWTLLKTAVCVVGTKVNFDNFLCCCMNYITTNKTSKVRTFLAKEFMLKPEVNIQWFTLLISKARDFTISKFLCYVSLAPPTKCLSTYTRNSYNWPMQNYRMSVYQFIVTLAIVLLFACTFAICNKILLTYLLLRLLVSRRYEILIGK